MIKSDSTPGMVKKMDQSDIKWNGRRDSAKSEIFVLPAGADSSYIRECITWVYNQNRTTTIFVLIKIFWSCDTVTIEKALLFVLNFGARNPTSHREDNKH